MWDKIKEFGKVVGRALGLIKHLERIDNHKRINASHSKYDAIDLNKRLYAGYVQEWHELSYLGTNNKRIERKQMTMGLPRILAREMAMLVFNEGVKIGVADTSKAQWDLIEETISSNKFKREFQRYLEYMFAMGGVAIEVYLDGTTPKIAYATADAFFPLSHDAEQVDEAVIANVFKQDGYTYTLLKWHEWVGGSYRITNELYKSRNANSVGDKVRLAEMFPNMAEVAVFNGLERPLFVYLKPNEANNRDVTSPLGVGVFENCCDTIRMLDVMYDFWYNEFRLGKRRVAVPDYLVRSGYNAEGQPFVYFDDSEELFVALNSGEMDGMNIKDLSVDIRAEQVIHSINSLLNILAMQVGLTAGFFTFNESGMKTATQVVSEQSKTFRTRSSHLNIIEDGLRDLILAVYQVANIASDSKLPDLERSDISIDFNDGVFEDKDKQLDFYLKLLKADLIDGEEVLQAVMGKSAEDAEQMIMRARQAKLKKNIDVQQAVADVELNGVMDV